MVGKASARAGHRYCTRPSFAREQLSGVGVHHRTPGSPLRVNRVKMMGMPGENRRSGDAYQVTQAERDAFSRDGYVHLEGVLSEDEIREVETVYMRFLRREISVAGRDFCDMSGSYERPIEEFNIINVMLPRRYFPEWEGNLYERRAGSIAEQLIGPDILVDYDQLLAKPPGKDQAVFHWHQDMAYWMATPDPRTASFWLALDDTRVDNGCMRFVPGSHREDQLRVHAPLSASREDSHTLVTTLQEGDEVRHAELRRGDVTVHSERVLHGSGGNTSDRWRRGYIVAYRSRATVMAERAAGFTHSHNDDLDVLDEVCGMGPEDE